MAALPGRDAELLRALAHEVGNLLAAIRLSAHLLAAEDAAASGAAAASDRRRSALEIERLAAQAGELLALLRPIVAGAPGRRARIAVGDVLAAVDRAFADAPRGALRVAPSPRGIPDVRVDPDALHHALLVLVRAALAAGGRRPVTLRAVRRDERVAFEVSDGGTPLDVAALAGAAVPRGRGLAVRIARAVVGRDRGRVEVSSSVRATRVRVVLPASPRRPRPRPGS